MKKYDIIFLNETSLFRGKNTYAYVGLASIEAFLTTHGFLCKTIQYSDIDEYLEQSDVFAFSVMDHTYEIARKMTAYLKGKTIIWGGWTATALPEYVLQENPNVDYVILGEGEQRLVDLLNSFKNKELFLEIDGIAYRSLLQNSVVRLPKKFMKMDDLPIPTDLVVMVNKFVFVELSRGCYGGCHYCQEVKKMRFKSPKRVVAEVLYWVSKGYKDFLWGDANGLVNGRMLTEIIDTLENEKAEISVCISGRPEDIIRNQKVIKRLFNSTSIKLDAIEVGIEANSTKMLNLIGRKTTPEINREAMKILLDLQEKYSPETNIHANMILFTHWDMTMEDLFENIKFMGEFNCSRGVLSLNLQGLAGTTIWNQMKVKGFMMQRRKGCQIVDYPFTDSVVDALFTKLVREPSKKINSMQKDFIIDHFALQNQVYDKLIEFYHSDDLKESIVRYLDFQTM